MSKFLEVGKYYYGLFDDADLGEHELPFVVEKISIAPLDDDEADWLDVGSDKEYRTEKGLPDYKKYDFDYSLSFIVDVWDESDVLNGDFRPMEDEAEIEKFKVALEKAKKEYEEYSEDMASKYPEY